jgi:hypothetical protein
LVCLSVPIAGAAWPDDPRSDPRSRTRPTATRMTPTAVAVHTTSIVGSAWTAEDAPIPGANLRLRNAEDGRIEAATRANDAGKFTFENVPPGSYVVELLNDTGRVETVGHVFSIAAGESVATFVRLGPRHSWVSAFFNNSAAVITTAAAAGGVTALAPPRLCSSPPCQD